MLANPPVTSLWSNSNGTADAFLFDTPDLQPGNYLVISGEWDRWVATDSGGNWAAEFGQPVPNYKWAAAQVFDTDVDISEVRPEQINYP